MYAGCMAPPPAGGGGALSMRAKLLGVSNCRGGDVQDARFTDGGALLLDLDDRVRAGRPSLAQQLGHRFLEGRCHEASFFLVYVEPGNPFKGSGRGSGLEHADLIASLSWRVGFSVQGRKSALRRGA